MKRMTEDQAVHIEGVIRPLIRSLRRNMKIVMGEDDLAQECLIRLLTASESKLKEMEDSYYKKVARNICIDQVRKEKAEKKALFGLEATKAPADADINTELWLNHLLEGVGWELQKTVRMKMKGFTNGEIAKAIGKSEKTVYRTLLKVAEFVERNRIESP